MMNAAGSFSKFDAVDAETRRVMQSRVNSGVRHNYETQNVKFLVWLFDHRQHYVTLLKYLVLVVGLIKKINPQISTSKSCSYWTAPIPLVRRAPN